jgi:hypothetical protein
MTPARWPLRFTPGTWARLLFFGLFGVAPAAVLPVGMLGADLLTLTDAGHDGELVFAGVLGLVVLVSVTVPPLMLKLRSPGPARVDLDERGITEWDGDAVRTSVPWSSAQVYALQRTVNDRRFGSVYVGQMVLSVLGAAGYSVFVTWGRRLSVGEGPQLPSYARRRRVVSAVLFEGLALAGIPAPSMAAPVTDPRDERRPLFVFARVVGALFLAAIAGAGAMLRDVSRTDNRNFGAIGEVPLRAVAVETDRDRRERGRIRLANRIEIAARVGLALLLLLVGVILAMNRQSY